MSYILRNKDPVGVALNVHLVNTIKIRRNIYRYLDYVDLVNCSLVNKTWNAEVTGQLKDKISKFVIHLNYCDNEYFENWRSKKTLLVEEWSGGNNNKMIHHWTFQEVKIKLQSIPNKRIWLTSQFCCVKSLEELLILFQSSVTHFTYGHQQQRQQKSVNILKFLYQNLPNVEYLCFNQPQKVSRFLSHRPSRLVLYFPRLRTLRLEGPSWCEEKELEMESVFPWPFIHKIVNSSPNLKKIFGFPLESTYGLGRSDSEHVVSKIRSLCYEFDGQLEGVRSFLVDKLSMGQLSWLTYSGIQLEEINLSMDFSKGSKDQLKSTYKSTVTQLVNSNALNLRKLTLAPVEESQRLILPVLPNLESLHLFGDQYYWLEQDVGGEVEFYEQRQNLSQIFPNLKKIFISISISPFASDDEQLGSFRKFFPSAIPNSSGQVLSSVRELTLNRNLPTVCLAELSTIVPEVKVITLNYNYTRMRNNLTDCCQLWPRLEEVTIEYEVYCQEEDEDEEEDFWDSKFTGFPEVMCKEMRLDPRNAPPPHMIEKCRIFESVCDLKCLRVLRFKFTLFDELNEENCPRIFSFVTGSYGFALRPHIQVLVDVDFSKFHGDFKCIKGMKKIFEPIAHHVKFNF